MGRQQKSANLDTLAQDVCHRLGLEMRSGLPAPGGSIVRLREQGAKSKGRPGWLRIFADGKGGIAGNWKTGESFPFFVEDWRDGEVSPEEVAARKAAIRAVKAAAEKARRAVAERTAARAQRLWQRGAPAIHHPYLRRKGVSAAGPLRLAPWGPILMVPIRTVTGELKSLQLIAADGQRRFLSGGEIQGNVCPIGFPGDDEDVRTILICEGLATALTLHEATSLPVLCAFSTSNLQSATNAVFCHWPAAKIVLCADDDWRTLKPVANPGLTYARKAAVAAGATLAIPVFDSSTRRDEDTDFNDMAAQSGLEAVAARIREVVGEPAEIGDPSGSVEDELAGAAEGYISRDGRIIRSREGSEPLVLANFAARIVSQVIVDDGVERTTRFKVRWRHKSSGGTFEIPAREFAALNWPIQEIGATAIIAAGSATRDHLRAAIQHLSGEVPRQQVFAQTGWREHDGRWVYLHNNGAIGGTGITTELRNGLQNFALPEPPEMLARREAIRASIRLLDAAPDRVSCPLFAAIWRAPLQQSDFSLVLVGQSGSGKSSLAALAQAHYGPAMWDRNGLPADWSSTANALEHMTFQAADALLVIDEGEAAQGSPAARAELDTKIGRILRAVGNQAARTRMKSDGTLVPSKPPRALVIATKEEALQGASLTARTLTLNLAPGELAGGKGVWGLDSWQTDAREGIYADALATYLLWLAEDLSGRRAVFRERFEDARKRLAHQLAHPRTADILAQLAAAARLFLLFAQETGAIASPEAGNLHRRILSGLVEAASEQLIAQTATDPVETFFTLFGAVLASGRGHVASISGGRPETPSAYGWSRNDFGWSAQGDLVGWVGDDGHSLYLQMEAAYAACQELARRTGQTIEVGDRALRKRIDNKGLILSKEGGKEKRLTTRVLIDGVKTTVLHVRNPLTPDEANDAAAEMPAATLIELRA